MSAWPYGILCPAAFAASLLTLFSGFGLGTVLTPVFCLFFPPQDAVAMTAVVHFANNVFKLGLLGRHADRGVVLRFGLPAVPAAFVGALLLRGLAQAAPLARYSLAGLACEVTALKLALGLLMAGFAILEARGGDIPALPSGNLALGGVLSGFLGGLSGHQGALRSAFLLHCGLSKETFLGTGIAIACLVDLARLTVYGWPGTVSGAWGPMAATSLAAFAGAFLGARLLTKVTFRGTQAAVAGMMLLISAGLAAGLL